MEFTLDEHQKMLAFNTIGQFTGPQPALALQTVFVAFRDGRPVFIPVNGRVDIDLKKLAESEIKKGMPLPGINPGVWAPRADDPSKLKMQHSVEEGWQDVSLFTTVCWWTYVFAAQKSVILRDRPRSKREDKWRQAAHVPAIRRVVVDIGPTAPPKEDVEVEIDGRTKRNRKRGTAYHSARAHWRRLPNGERRWIPMCWKGDPRYGVVNKKYNVRTGS